MFDCFNQETVTIARRNFQRRRDEGRGKNLPINDRIRKNPIRLIGEDDEQFGVVDTRDALQKARDAGLDLVMVAPNADPCVCKIMDYGKWKYQQKKKEQKAKTHTKQSELKEVRLRPGTDDHDLDIKINRAVEFFGEGHKVQFTILFRGRQMAHREIGFAMFNRIEARFGDTAHVEVRPRIQGRRMTMMMVPGPGKAKDKVPPPPRPAPAPAAVAPPPPPAPPQPQSEPAESS